jgi:hypothetical protein
MRLDDFRQLVERLRKDVPPEYSSGVVVVDVSPKTVPHPVRGDVYTLGECVPLEWSGSGSDLQSRIVLYHGSFAALARLGDFAWREEAWETLTHELRHHLEWRANVDALAAYDWAAEQNFARHEDQPFDPAFYRSGEQVTAGVWKIDDDVFIEKERGRGTGEELDLVWHGRRYRVAMPATGSRTPLFLTLDGLRDPPPGDAVLVVRYAPRLRDIVRRPSAPVLRVAPVTPLDG